jgi:hypothetical protein
MPADDAFVTAALAEIYLGQEMLSEARRVIRRLVAREPDDPHVRQLAERLRSLRDSGRNTPCAAEPRGRDFVELARDEDTLHMTWEITADGAALAKRSVRFSGSCVVRLFTAAPGPRGVRTGARDIEVEIGALEIDLRGLPRPAVHVAAAGYLARTGVFIPLAESAPLVVER